MQKAILLNTLNVFLFFCFFPSIVFAQLHDVIPSSAFVTPTTLSPTIKLTVSPSPTSTATASSQLENNILGVQQRNPALTNTDKAPGEQDLIGKIMVSLLIAMGATWLYKNRKDILTASQNSR